MFPWVLSNEETCFCNQASGMLPKSNKLENTKFPDFVPIINNLDSKNLENELVKILYKDKRVINRTKYQNTVNNLEEIFNKDDIFYALYENLH